MRIAHVTSEMVPLMKVGGLADMVSALSGEQARRGHEVWVVLPGYRDLRVPTDWTRTAGVRRDVPWGLGHEPATFDRLEPPRSGLRVLLVRHTGERAFFDRPGVYDDPVRGQGYPDNAERFLFFCRAAMEGLKSLGVRFDVLHAHDHQAGWVPCFVRTHDAENPSFRGVGTIFTLHNMGYQGIQDAFVLGLAGFGRELFYPASPFEFWGRVNYMKVGIAFTDMLSTVSPRYAEEIQSNEVFGFGLEGLLARRKNDLRGILNGIDLDVWNPSGDPHVPHAYGIDDMGGKALNRSALLAAAGLPETPDAPVVGMVSRLAEQKGFDLLGRAVEALAALDARFVVLGSGEPRYQELLNRLSSAYPDRVAFRQGFDEAYAHLIVAGADLYLMPSRYEPCGLNQMYAMRYGTPPVVREVGGLADTVQEFDPMTGRGTGFLFQEFEVEELVAALRRGLAIQRQPELWDKLRRNGMSQDFSWRASADRYDALYREARSRVASGGVPTLDSVRATT